MLQYRNPTLPSPLRSYYSEQYYPPRSTSRHEAKVSNANASEGRPTGAKFTPMDASRTRAPKPSKDLAQITSELELVEKKNKVSTAWAVKLFIIILLNNRKLTRLWQLGRQR